MLTFSCGKYKPFIFYGIGIAEFIRDDKQHVIKNKEWVTRFQKEK